MSAPHSIHVDFRPTTFAQLNRLRERLGAASYAEVIRRALAELERSERLVNGQSSALPESGVVEG